MRDQLRRNPTGAPQALPWMFSDHVHQSHVTPSSHCCWPTWKSKDVLLSRGSKAERSFVVVCCPSVTERTVLKLGEHAEHEDTCPNVPDRLPRGRRQFFAWTQITVGPIQAGSFMSTTDLMPNVGQEATGCVENLLQGR